MIGIKNMKPFLQSRLGSLVFVVALLFIFFKVYQSVRRSVDNRIREKYLSVSVEEENRLRSELATPGEKLIAGVVGFLGLILSIFLLAML